MQLTICNNNPMSFIRVVSVIPRITRGVVASGTLLFIVGALPLWPAERPRNPMLQECGTIVCNHEVVSVAQIVWLITCNRICTILHVRIRRHVFLVQIAVHLPCLETKDNKCGVYVVGNSKGDCQQNSCVVFHYHLACPPTLIWWYHIGDCSPYYSTRGERW
jgi:hypothetical protein